MFDREVGGNVMSSRVISVDFANMARVVPPSVDADETSSIAIVESDAFYEIRSALPGVAADDVFVGVDDDVLTIGAKAYAQSERACGRFFTLDHRVTLFEQSFALPPDADAGSLTTLFQDGVLSVFLTRTQISNVVPLFCS
jgi:HSP20 family molecular chaperone IbpA